MTEQRALKQAAAKKALEFIRPGMRLGIGTGSTAEEFIRLLAAEVRRGLVISAVPTSERSRALCAELGVPPADFAALPQLDITIDGADEIDSHLRLIKGGGGALLREKITAYASAEMLVIADESKLVAQLGAFPLPIEVNSFGLAATQYAIAAQAAALGLHGVITLRAAHAAAAGKNRTPFITDGGHYILDAQFRALPAPEKLAEALCGIAGVVEHGLFFHPHCRALVAQKTGSVKILSAAKAA